MSFEEHEKALLDFIFYLPPEGDYEFDGDNRFLSEFLEDFIAKVYQQILQIKTAISDQEFDQVRKMAHSIKGGAANLTAMTLSALAGQIEVLAEEGNLDDVPERLQQLKEALDRLAAFKKEKY